MVGPQGFTNACEVFEFEAGGQWRFVTHGPNGVHYPNHSQFIEVVVPGRIVVRHVNHPHFTTTVTLEDLGEQCRMTWHALFERA